METFALCDHVLMLHKNIRGIIIDIYCNSKGITRYTIESDIQGYVDDPDAYPGEWPQYECTAGQLKKI